MKRLAIVTTHPIQYNAPFFALLSLQDGIRVKVFYTWSQVASGPKFDPDFERHIEWDIPLLEGYDYEFVENTAKHPGSSHFRGIRNPSLVSRIEEWSPSHVLVYGWSFASHLQCIRHFKGKIPVLFRGDSTLLDEKPGIKTLARRIFLRWVYSHVDAALYVGEHNRRYFRAHGLKDQQLVFVPHAVDNDRFADKDGTCAQRGLVIRRELGIRDEDILLVFAGKMEEKKDPGFMIRLAARMQGSPHQFLLVGNGKLETSLKQQAEGLANVHFLDFQNQATMPAIYQMADIFVLPSLWNETWGLAINESMAAGRPVMTKENVAASADLLVPGQTGWLIPEGGIGISTTAEWLSSEYSSKANLEIMGLRAKERVQNYSYIVMKRQLLFFLDSFSVNNNII